MSEQPTDGDLEMIRDALERAENAIASLALLSEDFDLPPDLAVKVWAILPELAPPAPVDRVTAEELADVIRLTGAACRLDDINAARVVEVARKLGAEVTALRAELESARSRCASYAVRCSLDTEAKLRAELESLRRLAQVVYDLEYDGAFRVNEVDMPAFDALGKALGKP